MKYIVVLSSNHNINIVHRHPIHNNIPIIFLIYSIITGQKATVSEVLNLNDQELLHGSDEEINGETTITM